MPWRNREEDKKRKRNARADSISQADVSPSTRSRQDSGSYSNDVTAGIAHGAHDSVSHQNDDGGHCRGNDMETMKRCLTDPADTSEKITVGEITDRILNEFSFLGEKEVTRIVSIYHPSLDRLKEVKKEIERVAATLLQCVPEGTGPSILEVLSQKNGLLGRKEHPCLCPQEFQVNDAQSSIRRLCEPFHADGKTLLHVNTHISPLEQDVPLVLSGESGIGKTHSALFSNKCGLVVFLMFDEDFRYDHPKPPSASKDPSLGLEIDDRDVEKFTGEVARICVDGFLKRVDKKAVPSWEWLVGEMGKIHVRIVVDELGQNPHYLRMFIETLHTLRDQLRQPIKKPEMGEGSVQGWPGCKSLDVVLVGTGIDLRVSLGSNTDKFTIVSVPPAEFEFFAGVASTLCQWSWWQDEFKSAIISALSAADPALACIKDLIQNRRAAVLAAANFARVMDKYRVGTARGMQRVFREGAESIVYNAALEFKGLNALQNLGPVQLRHAAMDAFALSMPPNGLRQPTHEELCKYVVRLGVLVDISDNLDLNVEGGSSVPKPVHSSRPVLKMSPAMRLMLLVMMGFTDVALRCEHGAELRRFVALKCVLAMTMTADNQVLHQMLHSSSFADAPAEVSEVAAVFNPPSVPPISLSDNAPDDVVSLSLQHRLSSDGSSDDLESEEVESTLRAIAGHVNGGGAVVAVNSAEASYADVIVVRSGYVGFFQVMDTDAFAVEEAVHNLIDERNAKITKTLCDIARVRMDEVGVVVVSRQSSSSSGKAHSIPWLSVAFADEKSSGMPGDLFLFPFRWPARGTQRKVEHCFLASAYSVVVSN